MRAPLPLRDYLTIRAGSSSHRRALAHKPVYPADGRGKEATMAAKRIITEGDIALELEIRFM